MMLLVDGKVRAVLACTIYLELRVFRFQFEHVGDTCALPLTPYSRAPSPTSVILEYTTLLEPPHPRAYLGSNAPYFWTGGPDPSARSGEGKCSSLDIYAR